ncbi:hypothetical protein HN51_030282 [Arachis hypogaea]|uniref:F-box/kelch-repeat protein SKIP6-like isoform X1 n=1 Tax=Arachis hypogaea TaxID=3818 RepID=UPI000DED127E|nr:F-box/kelch-repeat protein SKIP6-like [Arachis hypogaea]QHO14747.1 F-box/kelch-repeat protein [Arachis hypogaea]
MMSCLSSSASAAATRGNPKPPQEQEKQLIPALPNEVAVRCLARVPRRHYKALSQVSGPIRSLLASPIFYNAHSAFHGKQPFLYLHLHPNCGLPSQWWAFSLASPPSPSKVMPFPIPPLPSPTYQAAYAILGHHIYVIGGHLGGILSQQVWILDCRINRWRQGPSMLIPRVGASTAVADGKIYVMGGRGRQLPDIWGEVLDPAVGRWVEADYNCLNSSSGDGTDFKKNRACFTVGARVVTCDARRVDKLWLGRNGWGCFEDGFFYTLEYPDKLVGHELGDMEESVEYWGKPWAVKGLLDLPMWYSIGTRRRPKQLAGSGSNGRSLFLVWIHYWNQQYELWCSQLDLNNTKRGDDWQLSATPSSSHKIFSSFDQFTIGGSLVVHDL